MDGVTDVADVADVADERAAWIALAHVAEPGDDRLGALVARVGAVEALDLIAAGSTGLRSGAGLAARLQAFDGSAVEDRADRCGARILTPVDRGWPSQLGDLGTAGPCALWVAGEGDLRLLVLRSVAVVGARACSPYGAQVAHGWAADLAAAGWSVLSGAAVGIDAAAHRGALAGGGVTVAVMAGGVDVPYPAENAGLLERIRADGLVVSESPPGEGVRRQRFLSRNRLIAALARATLVVEAALRSGAASTARNAAAVNRPVLAVPGPVTSPTSAGCHRMIRDGEALCVVDVDDVLAMLDLDAAPLRPDAVLRSVPWDALADRERRVLDALPRRGGLVVDEVVRAAGLAAADVLAALAVLEVRGLARADDARWRAFPADRRRPVTMDA